MRDSADPRNLPDTEIHPVNLTDPATAVAVRQINDALHQHDTPKR